MSNSIFSNYLYSKWYLSFIPFFIILFISILFNGSEKLFVYFVSFPLLSIINLLLIVPFLVIALLQAKPERKSFTLLILALIFFLVDQGSLLIPKIIRSLQWNWQGKLLSILSILLLIHFTKELNYKNIGLTKKLNKGSLLPVIIIIVVILFLGFLMAPHGTGASSISTWLFEATMPGLSEELLYRGVLLTITNKIFIKKWKFFGAQIGWGFILTTLLFSFVHMVSVKSNMDIIINWSNFFGPFTGGLVFAYVKERSDNLWTSVIFHNLTNTANVLVGYLP